MSQPFMDSVQIRKPKRNLFDLSHERKFSLDMGFLVPIMAREVLPDDSFEVTNEFLLRFAPMLAPIMHKVDIYTHYFYVPNRQIWSGWEDFITGNQGELPPPVHPYVNIQDVIRGSIADYIGLPCGDFTQAEKINALPFAAYNKIYNEYYRDQNLIDPLLDELVDGNNTANYSTFIDAKPHLRCWEHDLFTSALPFTQKGVEVEIAINIDTDIPVDYNFNEYDTLVVEGQGTGPLTNLSIGVRSPSNKAAATFTGNTASYKQIAWDNSANLSINLSNQSLITVNELRRAVALQQMLEKDARGGSRYIETILVHFGVMSDDLRLQRPQYLGGGKSKVAISEVLQTSQTDATPQGNMSGHGISTGQSHTFKSYHKEHGWIIGIMSVMPKTNYQQGIEKQFLKDDRYDYFWESLAHIGEQPIYNKELLANHPTPDDIFGYLPQYYEYKNINSTCHADFTSSLDYWHLGRIFSNTSPNVPALNENFVKADVSKRIFAVTDDNTHSLWCHMYSQVKAVRPVPLYGTPAGLV